MKVWVVYTQHPTETYIDGIYSSERSAKRKKQTLTAVGALNEEQVFIVRRSIPTEERKQP